MSATPSITIEPGGTVIHAKVAKKLLDDTVCNELLTQLVAAASERKQPVALDLSEVKYVPSMAIGTLVNLQKSLKGVGQKLMLVAVQPTVMQIFKLTHMDKVFLCAKTFEEASEKLAPSAA